MSSTTQVNPQILIKQTLCKTKKYCQNSLRNLKSFISVGYQKLSKTPTADKPMSSSITNKINTSTKVHELDNFYTSFSQQWDSLKNKEGMLSPKVQTKEDDEQYSKSSISVADSNGLEDLKQQKKETGYSGRKQNKGSSFRAADALARKMKELDMMDVNDMDHVLDVEEVLHCYSRLTCPTYMEIVDNFFVDMYSEFHVPKPSRSVNSSMRKLGTASVHSSMRSLGPLKL